MKIRSNILILIIFSFLCLFFLTFVSLFLYIRDFRHGYTMILYSRLALALFPYIISAVFADSNSNGAHQCFWPDGTVSVDQVPCSDGDFSSCCNKGDLCLDNGLCSNIVSEPITLSRGACTDPTWQSPNCPQYCSMY